VCAAYRLCNNSALTEQLGVAANCSLLLVEKWVAGLNLDQAQAIQLFTMNFLSPFFRLARLIHNCFLPRPFQFIVHRRLLTSTLYGLRYLERPEI